jgi:quaternary ammonium compound-resistance protein SugE
MMGWIYLLWASGFEIIFTLSLKYSEGYSKLMPSIIATVFAITSVVSLSKALNYIPISVAYAIWTGIGTIGANLLGVLLFRESLDWMKVMYMMMILGGVLGLRSLI